MRIRGFLLAALVVGLAAPAAASAATTIGNVTQPTGSTVGTCPPSPAQIVFSTEQSAPALNPQYTVPSGAPMDLTQWQINATGEIASPAQVTLVVLNINFSTLAITVVGTDTETLPTTLPPDKIVTFTPASPIQVDPGDALGVYINGGTGIPCFWSGGSGTSGVAVDGLVTSSAPVAGQTISPEGGSGLNQSGAVANVAATLIPLSYDAALSLSAGPTNAVVGQPAVLTATITNHGPVAGPVTFTDPVPGSLPVDYAGASSGSCGTNTAVNIVTCTIPSIAVGQSVKVGIVVTPKSAQTFSDSATLALPTGGIDPDPANNNATTKLKVSVPGTPTRCEVPKLGGVSVTFAKKLLPLLGCKVGKIKTTTSKSVAKGEVIKTRPGAGSYAAGKSVGLTVSSGKPKPKKKK